MVSVQCECVGACTQEPACARGGRECAPLSRSGPGLGPILTSGPQQGDPGAGPVPTRWCRRVPGQVCFLGGSAVWDSAGAQLSVVLQPGPGRACRGQPWAAEALRGQPARLRSPLRQPARPAHPRPRPAWLSRGPQTPGTAPEEHSRGRAPSCLPAPCPVPSRRVLGLGRHQLLGGDTEPRYSVGQRPGPRAGWSTQSGVWSRLGNLEPAACGPQRSRLHLGSAALPAAARRCPPGRGGRPGATTALSGHRKLDHCLLQGPGLELGSQGPWTGTRVLLPRGDAGLGGGGLSTP